MNRNPLKKRIILEYLPMTVTGLGILVTGIIFKQLFISMLPLFISLFVMLLNSRANRLGLLLGGLNSFIYCITYLSERLYTSVLSTIFGGVIAILSFFYWKKRSYGKATVFKKMSTKARIIGGVIFLLVWGLSIFILDKTNGQQSVLDSLTGLIGLLCPFLTMLGYVEDLLFYTFNVFVGALMWVLIAFTNVANVTFVIYSSYCCYMGVRRAIRWISLYKEQHKDTEVKAA